MTDSIIFDLDGTLWDSTEVIAKAWNQILHDRKDLNLTVTTELLKTQFGNPLPQIAANIFPQLTEAEQLALIEQCCRQEHIALLKTPGTVFSGVEYTLGILCQNYPLFIVSNCQAGYIETFLAGTGFSHYFKDFECPGNTNLSKGENISLIIDRNALKSPIYVGDTAGDEKSARFAGIPFFFAAYGFGQAENPDFTLHKPEDLVKLLQSLSNITDNNI